MVHNKQIILFIVGMLFLIFSTLTKPEIIKELRQKQNLTQKELADLLAVSDKTISKWETGVSQS